MKHQWFGSEMWKIVLFDVLRNAKDWIFLEHTWYFVFGNSCAVTILLLHCNLGCCTSGDVIGRNPTASTEVPGPNRDLGVYRTWPDWQWQRSFTGTMSMCSWHLTWNARDLTWPTRDDTAVSNSGKKNVHWEEMGPMRTATQISQVQAPTHALGRLAPMATTTKQEEVQP